MSRLRNYFRRMRFAIAARLVDWLIGRVLPPPPFDGGWACWQCLRHGYTDKRCERVHPGAL